MTPKQFDTLISALAEEAIHHSNRADDFAGLSISQQLGFHRHMTVSMTLSGIAKALLEVRKLEPVDVPQATD